MKKFLIVFAVFAMATSLLSGCNVINVVPEDEAGIEIENETLLPFAGSMEFYFSSGAGAWGTELYLEKDGRFTGSFHDTNMGEIGEDNPYGTTYVCDFSGNFEIVEKIDETSYKMTLSEFTTEQEEGEEWIEDGILYVASTPYGLEGGTEFIFYTPETKTDSVGEEFLWWWPERFSEEVPETLMHYGICNVETNDGFFSY